MAWSHSDETSTVLPEFLTIAVREQIFRSTVIHRGFSQNAAVRRIFAVMNNEKQCFSAIFE